MDAEEHEVYGAEIPDEAEMDGDLDPNHADDNAAVKSKVGAERAMRDEGEVEKCDSSGKSYQFGPFAPVAVRKKGVDLNKVCWERVGGYYRPQYQNQAMKELFSHYREAWKLWNSQAAETNPITGS